MLVCFVVPQRRYGRQIAADIIELAGAAADLVSDAGFQLLVNEPASARETIDAFLGELLIESTNATELQDAGLHYIVLVNEPANAIDDYAGIYAAGIDVDVVEPSTATETQDGTVVSAVLTRSAMIVGLGSVFVNSDGTPREANAEGVMLNL